jgi:hypothetical protein
MGIWKSETVPNDRNIVFIAQFTKKGSKLGCSNYQGIALLNVTYKTFTNTLAKYFILVGSILLCF